MAHSMSVKLTPEQLEQRRQQLDRTGTYAWASPIVLLLVIYIVRIYLLPLAPGSKRGSSPFAFLSTIYIAEFGPLYNQLLAVFYTAWLLYLTARGTGEDYMHLTKSFGHVAVAQLPVHYLLGIKSRHFAPMQYITGLTPVQLTAVHRLFGRIVHALLAAHAVLYLRFFVQLGILPKRIGDWDVRFGLMAFWSVNVLAVLAVPPIRRKAYKLFWRSHVVLSAVVPVALWCHVPYTRWIVGQVVVVYLANLASKVLGRTDGRAVGGKAQKAG
jgi:hypothetical protein